VTALVVPPAGWTGPVNQDLSQQSGVQHHFGRVGAVVEAIQFNGPNIVLYVTRASATTAASGDDADAELLQFAHPIDARTLEDKAITVEGAWHAADVSGTARMVIVTDAHQIVSVKGECYAGAAAQPADVAACTKALTTLDTGIAPADRVAIMAPSSVPAAPQLTTPGPSGTHVAMPPISVHQKAPADLRPVYVGAGLIVIAAVFWWNRRRAANVRG